MVKSFLDRNSCGRTSVLSCIAHLTTPSRICQERTFFPYNADVTSATRKTPAKRSEARERLLTTASDLFYAEGINSVGVDRIVSASNVTLATFYRHFPSKQDLVVSYLEGIHDVLVERAAAVADHRRWFYERVRRAFADAGHEHPSNPARHFVMLRDGAVTAGYLDSATAAQRTFKRGVDGLLRSIDMEILPDDGDES